jgi:hypothetical protein
MSFVVDVDHRLQAHGATRLRGHRTPCRSTCPASPKPGSSKGTSFEPGRTISSATRPPAPSQPRELYAARLGLDTL